MVKKLFSAGRAKRSFNVASHSLFYDLAVIEAKHALEGII
jgi:hypothetical protein